MIYNEYDNMDKSYKSNVEWREPNTEYLEHGLFYTKHKTEKNVSVLLEIRIVANPGGREGAKNGKKHNGDICTAGNTWFLILVQPVRTHTVNLYCMYTLL
jgi:hypothetical protein